MNIENMEAFVFVNHFGSINKAAKALFLSQPSVTSRIKTLERELDTKLFDRVGKRLVITDQAKEFIPYAEGIVRTFKKGKKRLEEKESSDQVVIGCTGLISNYLIPKIVPAFREQYSNVRIKIVTAPGEEILKKVLDGEVDIGYAKTVTHPLIDSWSVLENPIRLFVLPNHPFAVAKKVNIEELAIQPIVFFECGSLDWTMIHNLFYNLSQLPNIQYEVDNMETAKGLIMNGTGIGFLPELCVRNELAEGKLVTVDIPVISNVSLKTNLIYHTDQKSDYVDHFYQTARLEGSKILTNPVTN